MAKAMKAMNRKQLISQMYWKERAIAVSNQAHKRADKMEEGMLKALRLAESRIKRDIQSWYSKFAFDNEISMSEARKLLTEAELAEFKWTVDEYIELAKQYAGFGDPDWERRLANASARVHIQRLEALQLQIRAEIERATNEQQMIMSNGIPLIYEESYNKTLEALGETAAMSRVNTKAIEKIAEKPWTTDGKTFSGRIWENKEKLVNSLQTDLIQAVTRGDTHAEMTNRLAERMNTSRYNAGRLVRTETTYINAKATQDAYKENNVEKVEIIGTLDSRVCALCSDMDGITIDMKTYEPGVTVPPFHPMCRCTTAPAVEDIPDDIFEQLDAMFEEKTVAGLRKDDIMIHRSVGASGKNYPVLLPEGGHTKLAEGTRISKVVAIIGKGTGKELRDAVYLESKYGIKASEWQKVRGEGIVLIKGKKVRSELHWYEANGERFDMKVKVMFDEG